MARKPIHDYPPSKLLPAIAHAIEATRGVLETTLAGLARQSAEQDAAAEAHRVACEQATGSRWDNAWAKEHPSPPFDGCLFHRRREVNERLADLDRWGVAYDLAALAGTDDRSAKMAVSRAVKELVAAGLVVTDGCTSNMVINLTPAGWERVKELQAAEVPNV